MQNTKCRGRFSPEGLFLYSVTTRSRIAPSNPLEFLPMNLIYRGHAYHAPIAGIDAIESPQSATFLGRAYRIKHAPMRQPAVGEQLIYRGVRYSR
ncbi:MAG: DUF4278 domain-containing protein [Leptolyngbyaceae cyanobacterium T60_A2020_046]|nr:DUF4278 domain-containing protein [Leptolyngbyaceae cyanobacterium T60_A2020_046]